MAKGYEGSGKRAKTNAGHKHTTGGTTTRQGLAKPKSRGNKGAKS